jgi:hypothetical protein
MHKLYLQGKLFNSFLSSWTGQTINRNFWAKKGIIFIFSNCIIIIPILKKTSFELILKKPTKRISLQFQNFSMKYLIF